MKLLFVLIFCAISSWGFTQTDTVIIKGGSITGLSSFFSPRETKTDTVLIPCLCVDQAGVISIVEKRLEREQEKVRIPVSHYPYNSEDRFLTTITKWIYEVDSCYILQPAEGYSFD